MAIKPNNTSKTSMTQPYLRLDFWMDETRYWWNKPIYSDEIKKKIKNLPAWHDFPIHSQATRDRMNKVINDMISQERNVSKL